MQKDRAGNLSTLYTYGNQRINSESINNISGIYTYDGRGSVSSVIGGFGDYRATYWYDGLGNVIRNLYGAGDSNNRYKPYYGYNAESYNPVTGNQNLRARQLNIRRQRFLTEDTYLGNKTDVLSINRYIYARNNPLRYNDPSGYMPNPYLKSEQAIVAPNPNAQFIEVSDMTNGELSFALTTINSHLDNLFDFEISTGVGLEYGAKIGIVDAKIQYSDVYNSLDEKRNMSVKEKYIKIIKEMKGRESCQ